MTPDLKAAIDDATRVFARYTITWPLTVCHCDCCMTDETERALIATPLKEIPAELLAEYTNSAHAWDDDTVAREMRYFLPRYMELIAHNDPPDHLGSTSACAGSPTRTGARNGRPTRPRPSTASSRPSW